MVSNYREDICCVVLSLGDRYQKLAKVAVNSFKKHNPNIKIFYVDKQEFYKYSTSKQSFSVGVLKYMLCYEIAKKNNYSRVINLGADTITCAYLSEFIDNIEYDILATLDYPYTLHSGNFSTPPGDTHLNADVICFNNLDALADIIKASEKHPIYYEQGGLNEIVWSSNKYKTKIVDGPYAESQIIYNARAKGNIIAAKNTKPWKPYIQQFRVEDNKLFSFDNKQIKVFHYCEGLGTLDNEKFCELLNYWILDWFNEETKKFFKNQCDAGNFFEVKYEV